MEEIEVWGAASQLLIRYGSDGPHNLQVVRTRLGSINFDLWTRITTASTCDGPGPFGEAHKLKSDGRVGPGGSSRKDLRPVSLLFALCFPDLVCGLPC